MTDERQRISRREFTALTLAAGMSAAAGASAASVAEVIDTDVLVKTPSGTCDAALVHPQGGGRWPAVIIFTDIFGLRTTMRAMAKRLATNGFTVLVPNPFYRSTKAPGIFPDFDFGSPADRVKLDAFRAPMTSDATTFSPRTTPGVIRARRPATDAVSTRARSRPSSSTRL